MTVEYELVIIREAESSLRTICDNAQSTQA